MFERIRSQVDKLRKGKQDLADQTAAVDRAERQTDLDPNASTGGWKIYDSGARGDNGYFKENSRFSFDSLMPFEEVRKDIASRRARGQKTMTLDIMGQGRVGYDLGADTSLGWTYQSQGEEELPGRVIETGDLFDTAVVKRLMSNLEEREEKGNILTDVFFRAEGGLGMYVENPYALSHVYKEIFEPLYRTSAVGTRFFLGMKPYRKPIVALLDALKEEGYDVSDNGSQHYLLRKTQDKEVLPTLRSLASKYNLT